MVKYNCKYYKEDYLELSKLDDESYFLTITDNYESSTIILDKENIKNLIKDFEKIIK